MTHKPRLVDVEEIARLLGISSRHVYRLADSGRMPYPIKLGGAVRWDLDVISHWIDQGCPKQEVRRG